MWIEKLVFAGIIGFLLVMGALVFLIAMTGGLQSILVL